MTDFINCETKENEKNEDSEKIESAQDTSKVEENNLSLSESEKNEFDKLLLSFKNKYTYYAYDDDVESLIRMFSANERAELDTADYSVEVSEATTTIERIATLLNDDKTSEVVKYLLLYLYSRWKDEEGKRVQLERTNTYRNICGLLQDKRGQDKLIGEIENLLMKLKNEM